MANNQRKPISFEGKITILLALVGLGGVGFLQVLPHPYNDYVGWTLIWTAIIGIVALGVYHVATTVESPRYDPKPRPSRMTAADTGFLAATVAAAASLIMLGLRHRSAAAIIALIACLFVAFDFADRQWFANAPPAQIPIGPNNARLEGASWQFGFDPKNPKLFLANIRIANRGKSEAFGMRHYGVIVLANGTLSDNDLSAFFPMLKAVLVASGPPPKGEIHPGQNNAYFSVVSGELSDKQVADLNAGTQIPFVLNVMQYKDDLIPQTKFVYTESCVYRLPSSAVAVCHRGDNISYISD